MGKQRIKTAKKRARMFLILYWITVIVAFTAIFISNRSSDQKSAMVFLLFIPLLAFYALGISLIWNKVNNAWASTKAERQVFHIEKATEMLDDDKWRESAVLINEIAKIKIRDSRFNRRVGYLLGYWHALERLNNKELLTKS